MPLTAFEWDLNKGTAGEKTYTITPYGSSSSNPQLSATLSQSDSARFGSALDRIGSLSTHEPWPEECQMVMRRFYAAARTACLSRGVSISAVNKPDALSIAKTLALHDLPILDCINENSKPFVDPVYVAVKEITFIEANAYGVVPDKVGMYWRANLSLRGVCGEKEENFKVSITPDGLHAADVFVQRLLQPFTPDSDVVYIEPGLAQEFDGAYMEPTITIRFPGR